METTHKHIRGSSVLLGGRLFAILINFATQVLMVRYLTQGDYGLWAYSLSVVIFCSGIASLGLNKAVESLLPLHYERREYGHVIGTMLVVAGFMTTVGILVIAVFYMKPEPLLHLVPQDDAWPLLLILIFLVPFETLDALLVACFASFARPRAIFFRKHLLGPGMKLSVIAVTILMEGPILFLAMAYLVATIANVMICSVLLLNVLLKQLPAQTFRSSPIRMPVAEILGSSMPLAASDLLAVFLGTSATLFLGYFLSTDQVALFRVALPLAALNYLVMHSFAIMYTPQATRLFVNGDLEGLKELYWRTTTWITVLTFPVFALTFGAADAMTLLLYGERYVQSGMILAVMAAGTYFQVVMGFSQNTLRAMGNFRAIFVISIGTLLINVALSVLLIPRFSGIGAALATAASFAAQSILRQIALHRTCATIRFLSRANLPFYSILAGCSAVLLLIQISVGSRVYLAIPLVSLVSVAFLALTKSYLRLRQTFPELGRLRARFASARGDST